MDSKKIGKYVNSIKLSDRYVTNFNNFNKLCLFLSGNDFDDEFDVCYKILKSCSNVYSIVKSVVDNNFDVVKNGNISSLNSNEYFIQFIQIYCIDNGIDIFSNNSCGETLYNSDINSSYFSSIRNNPILSREEELNLFKLYSCADSATKKIIRDKIINSNLRFVVSVAMKYNFRLSLEDLIQEGNLGLICAFDNYDYTKGFRFITYAFYHIRNRLIRAIKNQSSNIKIPFAFYDKIKIYKNFTNDYMIKYGNIPSNQEVARETGLSYNDIVIIERDLSDVASLDEMIDSEDDSSMNRYNCIADGSVNIEDLYDISDLKSIISEVFKRLNFTDQQIDILVLRYGLDGSGEHTYDYIGKKYNITRERVRQIIVKLLLKIRRNRYCLELLASYMPSTDESFNRVYLKRGSHDV